MAITAKKQLVATWYTPESQESEESPARFKVRPLTGSQALEVYDHFDGKKRRFLSSGIHLAMAYGLVDWENVTDENGNKIECVPSNFKYLPPVDANELGNHIIEMASLSGDEEKNSG